MAKNTAGFLVLAALVAGICRAARAYAEEPKPETIVLAGGCLWGVEVESETPGMSFGQTPKMYLGTACAEHFASSDKVMVGNNSFSVPKFLPSNHWALSGKWRVDSERITAEQAGAKLQLNFNARKVSLVLGAEGGKPVKSMLTLNGEKLDEAAGKDAPKGTLTIKSPRFTSSSTSPTPTMACLKSPLVNLAWQPTH